MILGLAMASDVPVPTLPPGTPAWVIYGLVLIAAVTGLVRAASWVGTLAESFAARREKRAKDERERERQSRGDARTDFEVARDTLIRTIEDNAKDKARLIADNESIREAYKSELLKNDALADEVTALTIGRVEDRIEFERKLRAAEVACDARIDEAVAASEEECRRQIATTTARLEARIADLEHART